jgi:hypothetical protein
MVLCLCLLGSAQARTLADPIVGTWSFAHGTVRVTAAGSGFVGMVTQPLVFEGPAPGPNGAGDGDCVHPAGEQIWSKIVLTPGYSFRRYSGDAVTRNGTGPGSCGPSADPGIYFRLSAHSGGRQELQFCAVETQNFPGGCASAFGPAKPKKKPAGPAGRVQFFSNFTIGTSHGGPDLGPGYKSTYVEGDLTFKGAEVTGQKGEFLVGYEYENDKTLDVHLEALGVVGKPDLSGPVKSVVFRIAVHSSQLPGCTAGQRGTLSLADNGPKGHDMMTLTLCGRTRSYVADTHFKHDLSVNIKPQ